MTLPDLVQWFLPRFQAEVPSRTHSRDTAENGNPELAHAFLNYVSDGEKGHWHDTVSESQDYCIHPTVIRGHCPTCDDTGLRVITRQHYRRPMKRALWLLGRQNVPTGRPRFDTVLWALGVAEGNWQMAAANLSTEYGCMADLGFAGSWTYAALLKLRSTYREDVTARVLRGKSEQQQIAEAA